MVRTGLGSQFGTILRLGGLVMNWDLASKENSWSLVLTPNPYSRGR